MELKLKKSDEIWTKDDQYLGQAHHLNHRTKDVNPKLQLYGSYLYVVAFDMGDDFHIPTDFIEGRDPETDRVKLKVTMKEVMKRTWTRLPDFIVHGEAELEELPAALEEVPAK